MSERICRRCSHAVVARCGCAARLEFVGANPHGPPHFFACSKDRNHALTALAQVPSCYCLRSNVGPDRRSA